MNINNTKRDITTGIKDTVRANPFSVLILGEISCGFRTFTDEEFVEYVADRRQVGSTAPDIEGSDNAFIRYIAGDEFNATPLKGETLHDMIDDFMNRVNNAPELIEARKDEGYHAHMAHIKNNIENI